MKDSRLSSGQSCIATAFFDQGGVAPNLRASERCDRNEAYYKCFCVFFATARRCNPSAKLLLVTNIQPPSKYTKLLGGLSVSIECVEERALKYVNDEAITNRFPGCLFSLDVLLWLESCSGVAEYKRVVLCDSDIVFLGSLQEHSAAASSEVLGVRLRYPEDYVVNGQSRQTLTRLYNSFVAPGETRVNNLEYAGGEAISIPVAKLSQFNAFVARAFQLARDNTSSFGNQYTEEHFYSLYIASQRGMSNYPDFFVSRVWTTHGYRNVVGDESKYLALHYPAEKDRFFKIAFSRLEILGGTFEKMSEESFGAMVLSPVSAGGGLSSFRRIILRLLHRIKYSIGRLFSAF